MNKQVGQIQRSNRFYIVCPKASSMKTPPQRFPTILLLVLSFSHASSCQRLLCCDAVDDTITCNPNTASTRRWSLCELLFPSSKTTCTAPGLVPRPSITKLLLASSNLHNVSEYALYRIPTLQLLDLSDNQLMSLPRNSSGWLPKSIVELRLSHNKLEHLPISAFLGLARLAQLYVNNNRLSSIFAQTFASCPLLEVLDLSFNRLNAISAGVFQRLRFLTELKLNNNLIKQISRSQFSNLVRLKLLDLKSNYLTIIPWPVLKPLRNLEVLKLKNNLLFGLDVSSVVSLSKISYLDVSANSLQYDNTTFSDGQGLPYHKTMIISISTKLRILKLSSAFRPSTSLPPFVEFRPSFNQLRSLDVSNTAFASCSLTFLGLEGLTALNLSGGQCNHVSDIVFDYLPNLTNLSMSAMQLDRERFHKQSRRLFNKLGKLRTLDLSHNHLLSLDPGALRYQSDLRNLNLSWNRLRGVPVDLAHHPDLTVLDLSHNMLTTVQPHERTALEARAGSLVLMLHGNPFSCACSNAEFLRWWSRTSVAQRPLSDDGGASFPARHGQEALSCFSEDGEELSVMDALATCPSANPGPLSALKILLPLFVLGGVAMVVTVVCCRRRRSRGQRLDGVTSGDADSSARRRVATLQREWYPSAEWVELHPLTGGEADQRLLTDEVEEDIQYSEDNSEARQMVQDVLPQDHRVMINTSAVVEPNPCCSHQTADARSMGEGGDAADTILPTESHFCRNHPPGLPPTVISQHVQFPHRSRSFCSHGSVSPETMAQPFLLPSHPQKPRDRPPLRRRATTHGPYCSGNLAVSNSNTSSSMQELAISDTVTQPMPPPFLTDPMEIPSQSSVDTMQPLRSQSCCVETLNHHGQPFNQANRHGSCLCSSRFHPVAASSETDLKNCCSSRTNPRFKSVLSETNLKGCCSPGANMGCKTAFSDRLPADTHLDPEKETVFADSGSTRARSLTHPSLSDRYMYNSCTENSSPNLIEICNGSQFSSQSSLGFSIENESDTSMDCGSSLSVQSAPSSITTSPMSVHSSSIFSLESCSSALSVSSASGPSTEHSSHRNNFCNLL